MAAPSDFFTNCYGYLKNLPVLKKPNSKTHPSEYFLYQLLQCFISCEETSFHSTLEILEYLKTLVKIKISSKVNIESLFRESESAIKSDEEKQQLKSTYQERTLKRKMAYEYRTTNPQAYQEFNTKRVKKIQHRRQTEPATSRSLMDSPQYFDNKSPGFVVSSQEEEETPARPQRTPSPPQQPAYADSLPAEPECAEDVSTSPYNPFTSSYEPSVADLFNDGYKPNVISTPAYIPPALNGDMEFVAEFTPRRSTEDMEDNLADVAADLEGTRYNPYRPRDRNVLSRSPSPRTDRSRSKLRDRSRSYVSHRSPSASSSSSKSSSSSSESSRRSSPVRPQPPPPPPHRVAKNRTKGVAFMIKNKGEYACMSGYSSYLKSKIKRTQGVLLVEPMYINNDDLDLAKVWTDLSQKILSKFKSITKTNKTLKTKSISNDLQESIKIYIVKQLRKLNFE